MASIDSRRNALEPRGRSPLVSAITLVALYVAMYLAVALVERMVDPVSAGGIDTRSVAAVDAAAGQPAPRCGNRGSEELQCPAD